MYAVESCTCRERLDTGEIKVINQPVAWNGERARPQPTFTFQFHGRPGAPVLRALRSARHRMPPRARRVSWPWGAFVRFGCRSASVRVCLFARGKASQVLAPTVDFAHTTGQKLTTLTATLTHRQCVNTRACSEFADTLCVAPYRHASDHDESTTN